MEKAKTGHGRKPIPSCPFAFSLSLLANSVTLSTEFENYHFYVLNHSKYTIIQNVFSQKIRKTLKNKAFWIFTFLIDSLKIRIYIPYTEFYLFFLQNHLKLGFG